jgi:phage gp36-like protein
LASTYATVAEFKARFRSDADVAHLTDDAETGIPDDEVIQGVIDMAEGEINSYAARKYLVPMDVTDTAFAAFMRAITLNMAVWYLVGQRNDIVSDAKQKAYDDAVLWLEKLGSGKVEPPVAAAPEATTTRDPQFAYGVGSDAAASNRKFTRASQGGL